VVLKSVLSKAIPRCRAKFMLQDATGSRNHKSGSEAPLIGMAVRLTLYALIQQSTWYSSHTCIAVCYEERLVFKMPELQGYTTVYRTIIISCISALFVIILPSILCCSRMPILYNNITGGRFLCALFFLCLTLASLSSIVAMVEKSVRVLIDYGSECYLLYHYC